jgi:hypothetical protein
MVEVRGMPKTAAKADSVFDWIGAVRRFDLEQQRRLATERAFSSPSLAWLTDRGDIGALLVRGKLCVAFPVPGTNGNVIGAHYRLPEKNADGKHRWSYTPAGLEIGPLVLGELATAEQVFFFESQWDAIALIDRLALHELIDAGEIAVVCTRGAEFGDRLEKISLLQNCASVAFPQNDTAGEGWLNSIIAGLVREARVVRTPLEFKDVNDWTRAGAKRAELVVAIKAAPVRKPQRTKVEGDGENTRQTHSETQSERRYDPKTEVPPEEQTYPYPKLDEVAFYGPFGRIVKAVAPLTEADPVAILIQLLVGWGNLIGRGAHFSINADQHFTNLFCCIVGRTSKARKGLGLGVAGWVLHQLDQAWFEQNICSGLSSGEGLIWMVRDPSIKSRAVRGNKKCYPGQRESYVEDEGVADKRILVAETEFGSALTVMGRSGNNLSHVIRDALIQSDA